jgi:hypothetical protein
MNDNAAPSLFVVPYKFDQWCMGCRRPEEEPADECKGVTKLQKDRTFLMNK